jgi:hypothetical protein
MEKRSVSRFNPRTRDGAFTLFKRRIHRVTRLGQGDSILTRNTINEEGDVLQITQYMHRERGKEKTGAQMVKNKSKEIRESNGGA